MKGKYDKPFVQLPGSIWYIESSVAGEKEMRWLSHIYILIHGKKKNQRPAVS